MLRLDNWRCDCEFSISMGLPCRHVIAYRKKVGVAGPIIPWNCIHERWTSPSQKLNKVRQFAYERFRGEGFKKGVKSMRSQAERYKEALRATHLIANELADIEDEEEFTSMLEFVLNQWRNVRQRKMSSEEHDSHSSNQHSASVTTSTSKCDDWAGMAEFGISNSSEEELEAEQDADSSQSSVKIRLNPKSKKVGRPKKLKSDVVAGERAERKWFDAVERGRNTAGEVTLEGLMEALEREEPTLVETQRRLSGVMVKYGDADTRKPALKKLKNPVLILDAFYILPPKLLDACLKLLPISNTEAIAISVDDDDSKPKATENKLLECVHIKGIGTFSRRQIELFKRVQNLKDTVQLGVDMSKWLLDSGLPSLPAEYHDLATTVAEEVANTFPYKHIAKLPNLPDYKYSLLYRATPPTWLSDAAIRALCDRLVADFPKCRFAGFVSASTKKKRTRTKDDLPVDSNLRDRLLKQVTEPEVDTVHCL
ncbi:hypothetical protein L916_07848, partial [Phytophthora nicotianae]